MSNTRLSNAASTPAQTAKEKSRIPNTQRLVIIIALAVLYYILASLPTPSGLTPEGQKALALAVVAVLAWTSEVLPLGISALFFTVIQHPLGIVPLGPAVANFAIPTVLFIIASFFLAIAMQESGLSRRVALSLSVAANGNPKKVLLYFILAAGACSTVISDVPVSAAYFPIGLAILAENNLQPGTSNFGRALMIGIPFAALIGGVGTPAGSSLNVLSLGLLKSTAGVDILFAQWTAIGLPMVMVILPAAWLCLLLAFPPEIKQLTGVEKVRQELAELGTVTAKEWKFITILVLLIIVWLTDFIHKVPLPVTTVLGATLFFLPGIDLLDWGKVKDKVGWDIVLFIGCANAIGMALWQKGAAGWLATTALSGLGSVSPVMVVVIVSFFVTVVHLIVPVNNALVAVMVPALVALAGTLHMNAAFLVLPMAFTASSAFLLPLDPVPLITYASGHYKFTDFFKGGWLLSLVWVIVMTAAMVFIAKPLGLM